MPDNLAEFSKEPSSKLDSEVTGREYREAVIGLERFLQIDVEAVHSLEDLSAKASLVGRYLKGVILANGRVQEIDKEYEINGRKQKITGVSYLLEKQFGDKKVLATYTDDNVFILVMNQQDNTAMMDFSLSLPLHSDLLPQNNEVLDMVHISANDWRNNKIRSYFPSLAPNDSERIQGFAQVLKDGVQTILSLVPKPSTIPERFNF